MNILLFTDLFVFLHLSHFHVSLIISSLKCYLRQSIKSTVEYDLLKNIKILIP